MRGRNLLFYGRIVAASVVAALALLAVCLSVVRQTREIPSAPTVGVGEQASSVEPMPLSRQPEESAEASLGLCFFHGWGCERNYNVAFEWYLKAAEAGHLAAMSDLAYCYMHGFGVVKEPEEGFRWALKAAERGHAPAQVMVAECYLDGRGTETNNVRAEVWLQSAARQGNKRAQLLLGEERQR